MTEITAPKSAVTAEQFADEIREQLKYTQGVTVEQAKSADVYVAASAAEIVYFVFSYRHAALRLQERDALAQL